MARIGIAAIEAVCAATFKHVGVPDDEAELITASIVYAHRRGKGTHGIGRLPIYVKKITGGVMSASTPLELVSDRRMIRVFDAGNGFGQVAGYRGMAIASERALEQGVGVVGIRNSNNFGTAGFIVEAALEKGMIGLVFANSAPAIAPTGSGEPLFGTNPMGLGLPVAEPKTPIILDMATSAAARGKIRLAAKQGDRIPLGWALDAEGAPTDDPHEALKGSMVPIGGAKGYGLSLMVDVLAGLLTGSGFAGTVLPLASMAGNSGYGHLLIAMDPEAFMDRAEYDRKMAVLIERTKACGDGVLLPGEGSYIKSLSNERDVEVSSKQVEDVTALIKELGLHANLT